MKTIELVIRISVPDGVEVQVTPTTQEHSGKLIDILRTMKIGESKSFFSTDKGFKSLNSMCTHLRKEGYYFKTKTIGTKKIITLLNYEYAPQFRAH